MQSMAVLLRVESIWQQGKLTSDDSRCFQTNTVCLIQNPTPSLTPPKSDKKAIY